MFYLFISSYLLISCSFLLFSAFSCSQRYLSISNRCKQATGSLNLRIRDSSFPKSLTYPRRLFSYIMNFAWRLYETHSYLNWEKVTGRQEIRKRSCKMNLAIQTIAEIQCLTLAINYSASRAFIFLLFYRFLPWSKQKRAPNDGSLGTESRRVDIDLH